MEFNAVQAELSKNGTSSPRFLSFQRKCKFQMYVTQIFQQLKSTNSFQKNLKMEKTFHETLSLYSVKVKVSSGILFLDPCLESLFTQYCLALQQKHFCLSPRRHIKQGKVLEGSKGQRKATRLEIVCKWNFSVELNEFQQYFKQS